MKLAMLLVSVHFLATAVEARPGGSSRQLGKHKNIPNAIATVGSARLPTVTANRAPGAEADVVSALNARFRAGRPSDDPASAGVVVHAIDSRDQHLVKLGHGGSIWRPNTLC